MTAPHDETLVEPAKHTVAAEDVTLEDDETAETTAAETGAAPATPERHAGDVFVQRFSGSWRKAPVLLIERTVAVEDGVATTDWTLEEGKKKQTLRVRTRATDADAGAVVSVMRVQGEIETPATRADFDALMERTSFAADTNEGLVATEDQTCTVGQRELQCRKVSYSVTVGNDEATLSIVTSPDVVGRDVSGEITTKDGKLVYRAELVEMGSEKPSAATASAQ